jgi:hypothetical protein
MTIGGKGFVNVFRKRILGIGAVLLVAWPVAIRAEENGPVGGGLGAVALGPIRTMMAGLRPRLLAPPFGDLPNVDLRPAGSLLDGDSAQEASSEEGRSSKNASLAKVFVGVAIVVVLFVVVVRPEP